MTLCYNITSWLTIKLGAICATFTGKARVNERFGIWRLTRISARSIHDGRLKSDQGQLFYEFHPGDAVPEDHLVRKIDAALDLSWLRSKLASHYSPMGRPSIDPELMIRMLVVGYVFAIRSERLICREVQVNLAYRWFCKLGIEDAIPDHSAFSRARNERFREAPSGHSV